MKKLKTTDYIDCLTLRPVPEDLRINMLEKAEYFKGLPLETWRQSRIDVGDLAYLIIAPNEFRYVAFMCLIEFPIDWEIIVYRASLECIPGCRFIGWLPIGE
jgi:hypothetical protein